MKKNYDLILKRYQNLYSILKISRLNTISEIFKINNNFEKKISYIFEIKKAIEKIENKHKIESSFYKNKKNKNNKKLWIYISEPIEIKTINYNKINELLKEKIDKNKDRIIVIGEIANAFANKENLQVIFSKKNNLNSEIKFQIEQIIINLFLNKEIDEVFFILNTNRIKNWITKVIPMDEFDFQINNYNINEQIIYKDEQTLFPDILNILENLFFNYIKLVVNTLFEESIFFKYKQKLLYETKKMNELEQKIYSVQLAKKEEKRKELTEEIILISQYTKEENDEKI
ncbi:MSC_0622 family F1-like ATPase gamma subunit [Mesomycoplasma molare]|uniref:MSC_0622 family F1-like ATPase gamma subunit n=1 Tax=Mesomycoplasma molare TaxID=171288 RepID=UPI0004869D24|nr:hypothetical protein [Mesomycoplasma molare]